MFKKVFLIAASLVFAFGILMVSVYQTSAQTVSEKVKNKALEFEITEEAQEATLAAEKVDYALTWPGILPDHFLYPVKMLRDKIWLFLATDGLKKAELLLKLADKRIWSAQMLLEKGEIDLAISTATKAEKYLERALAQEEAARSGGKDTGFFLEKVSLATLKHKEVLLEMKEAAEDSVKPSFESILEYPQKAHEEVMGRLGGQQP